MFGYEYSHSGVDGNGLESVSFMITPPELDEHDLVQGTGVQIMIDNKRQKTEIYRCRWVRGAPCELIHLLTLRDEVLGESEIPTLMKRLGIEVEVESHDT